MVNQKGLRQSREPNQHPEQIDGFGFISDWIRKECKFCEPISVSCVVIQNQIKQKLISTLVPKNWSAKSHWFRLTD